MYAALTWLLAQAAARRGDDVMGDARRRAALRRAPQIPTAAPLPFRAPGVLPVDAEPHTAAAAVGDLKQRLEALREAAPPPPSDLRARLAALKAAKAEVPEARANFYESAGFCPAPADEPAPVAPAETAEILPTEVAEMRRIMDALNEDADPLDAVRASLARNAALTQETVQEAPPDPLQEAQRKAALKAMREREARVAQFFDLSPPAPGSRRPSINPREPSFAARQTRRADALRKQRSAVVDVSKSPSAAPAAFDGSFDWSAAAEETAAEAAVPAAETAPAPARPVPADFTEETARILYDPTASAMAETAPAVATEAVPAPAEETVPSAPQVSFAGLLLALALALSLPLCVVALAASAVWRRRAPPVIETRETPINERYATRTETASELVEMDERAHRVHREARAASLEAEKLRRILHRWRDSPRRPSVASLLKARRDLRASQFERQNRFDRDDAVAVETPLVKEVRFDARTPASAIVSESDGDSPVVAASPPRKLYLEAPPVRNRSAVVAWVLLAAFVARDLAPRRQAPAPTPRPSMEPTYVGRAPPELVDDVAMVPAIAPPVKVALRPLAIAKAALAPMAVSAAVAAVLPPRIQAALGLHALHALDRLRRAALAVGVFVARRLKRRGPAGAPLSAMHFSAP